jgi:hypothetical protein
MLWAWRRRPPRWQSHKLLILCGHCGRFLLHQFRSDGGLFGQYYLQELGSRLKTFGIHWRLVTVYLILYASV